jgi:ketosteroid isomerase-like protein
MATKGSQLLLAVLLVACGPSGPQVDVEAERSAVLEADRAWSQTPPDVEAFVSNFTPDGAFLGGNAPAAEGIEAVRSSTREMFGAPGFALSWSASRADVSACGDLAYTVGTYEITSNDAAGNAQTRPGKYVTVWKKQADGTWRVVVDAPSENAPPAPPPAPPFELKADSVELDPDHYTLEFENDQVRILRIKYDPGEKSVMHEHPDSVAVLITEQNVRMHAPDGTASDDQGPAGQAQWADAVTHLPENVSDQPLEVVLVELKTKSD